MSIIALNDFCIRSLLVVDVVVVFFFLVNDVVVVLSILSWCLL